MRISVIVPLYKGGKFIGRITSMCEKEYQVINKKKQVELELIFVNDYPEESIDCPQSDTIDIKIVTHQVNCGIHQARVSGLQIAQGEYIHFLDQDDFVEDDFLLSMVTYISEHGADICVGNGVRNYPHRTVPIYRSNMTTRLVENRDVYIYGTDMIFSPGQCLIKKESIPQEWKQLIMKKNGSDDFFLWLIMLSKGAKISTCPIKSYHHVDDGANLSASKEKMNLSFREMLGLIRDNNLLPLKDVEVLERRLQLKEARVKKRRLREIEILISNPKIAWYTLKYKLMGFV